VHHIFIHSKLLHRRSCTTYVLPLGAWYRKLLLPGGVIVFNAVLIRTVILVY